MTGTEATAAAIAGDRRTAMTARLYKALDDKMRIVEERIARTAAGGEGGGSAADSERDARTLNSLLRLFAKLNEIDDRSRAAKAGEAPSGGATADDAERLRRDLAGRLARLSDAGHD